MSKVYCKDCKYFVDMSEIGYGTYCCLYIAKEDYLSPDSVDVYFDMSVCNENNNCQFYKPTLWKSFKNWIKGERG